MGFFDQRFAIVAGKGGVGKSTISAALGVAAARRGLRTLVLEFNATDRIPALFGNVPEGTEPLELQERLFTLNVRPECALEEYGVMKLRSKAAYKVVFQNDFMKRFLQMIPGLKELLLIGKAWNMESEKGPGGKPVWDQVIVDAPSTGHGIALFLLPHAITSTVRSGPMAKDARQIEALLSDATKTSFNIVTLPEELAHNETLELLATNRAKLHLPEGQLFVNQVWPEVVKEEGWQDLRSRVEGDPELDPMLKCVGYLRERRLLQEGYLDRIGREISLPMLEVPYLFTAQFGAEEVGRIADHLESVLG